MQERALWAAAIKFAIFSKSAGQKQIALRCHAYFEKSSPQGAIRNRPFFGDSPPTALRASIFNQLIA